MTRKKQKPKRESVTDRLRRELWEANASIAMLANQLADKREIIRKLTS